MSLYRLEKYANGNGDPIDTSDAMGILSEVKSLKKELEETKLLLEGADITFDKIAKLVGYNGQYRDLVEAVEMKLLHSVDICNNFC
jgi:hypothetical protein